MRSIRTKIIILNVVAIATAIITATVIAGVSVAKLGHSNSEEMLRLNCESGQSDLDHCFESVQQCVDFFADKVDDELEFIDEANFDSDLRDHVAEAEASFLEAASDAHGVYNFYYRIDPTTLKTEQNWDTTEKGFWYIKEGNEFKSHEVTDISNEENECRWFHMPKDAGKALWLTPYKTDTILETVLSYNAPVYKGDKFIGVIGIEVNYQTFDEVLKDISIHKSGRAYVVDDKTAVLIYHPDKNLIDTPENERPALPQALKASLNDPKNNNGAHIEYKFEGVEKHAYWLPLANGMSIVVAVPLSEVSATWIRIVVEIAIAAVIIMAIFIVFTIFFSSRFTKPLVELTEAAEKINAGDYNVKLDNKGNDEIGVLTTTVNKLVEHLGGYINDLNALAYADALTSVRNKSAFDISVEELDSLVKDSNVKPEFAIAIFDCDDLKDINDNFGHEKGDVYLKNSSHLICRVFNHSVVYRIGGDEFAIILQGEDYRHRESLKRYFIEKSSEICAFAREPWEQIRVAVGVAVYNSEIDKSVQDVMVRADHLMYDNKHERKSKLIK